MREFETFFKENYARAYFLILRITHDAEVNKDISGIRS